MLKGSKVLVAGGAGFIGCNLLLRLLSLGCHVRATLHKRPKVIQDDRIEYINTDLTFRDDCRRAVAGMDFVFMCAAQTSGAAIIESTPLVHLTANIVMNAQLLEAAYYARVKKFVFISSSVAYPPTGDRPVREDEIFNGEPFESYACSGWMKRNSEVLCRIYSQKLKDSMATVVIRPSNIYGPYDDFNFQTSHMMAALIRRVVERHNPIEVWGTGEDVKDLIFIEDFLDGLMLAFEKCSQHLEVNIAAGQGYLVKDVLQDILEVEDYLSADIRFDPSKPTMIPIRLLDISYARSLLRFFPKVSLKQGIYRTISWYREKYHSV